MCASLGRHGRIRDRVVLAIDQRHILEFRPGKRPRPIPFAVLAARIGRCDDRDFLPAALLKITHVDGDQVAVETPYVKP